MNIQSEQLTVKATPRSTLEFTDVHGHTLACLEGTLWVTQHMDTYDWVLLPGQSMTIVSNGPVFVSACRQNATFFLSQRVPEPCEKFIKPFLPAGFYQSSISCGDHA
ncbi:hypothetical protein MIZ03_4603 [Rhodoferax lithotrophicus]|uniref:DUF2917 domain-containing protein n=1 Tax=Rhodoferax lithotrophicus TaxID=2798804 RepID=A0ABM7MTU9_9BURK|nr:DUF2917 domain-containing protein [Rhodoferax sp. MIZ03]BCO29679.1 hypothetical protein MIZ03_4603 [Rhodoferax sp. MIZ03]